MPPKKKGNATELTDYDGEAAANDDKHIENIITKAVEKAVAGVKHEFADLLNAKLDHIFKELTAMDELIVELPNENGELCQHVNSLILRQDAAVTYSRVNNLVIHGLPPSYSEAAKTESVDPQVATRAGESTRFETSRDSKAIFFGYCGEFVIDIQPTDIEACHRLPRSAKSKHSSLLVRFTNRRIRATVLGVRKKLNESKKDIFVNEHLTKPANEIFASTRHLQKQKNSGRVMVRLLDGKTREISSKGDLVSLS